MFYQRNGMMRSLLVATVLGALLGMNAAVAQQVNVAPESSTVEGRSAMAISYPEGPTISVKFKGTSRLPKANGEAKVQRKRGMTEIEIELDEMKPATSFGGDYATYVLWVVTPEGQVDNIGEFILRGNRSKLNVSTTQQTFAMFVTAEPHFLTSSPSRFVVAEDTRPTNNLTGQMLSSSTIKYRGYDGAYQARRETLNNEPEAKGEIRSDVRQAMVAVKLAERAGANEFAAAELAKAREALNKTLEADEANVDPKQLMVLGHETVRMSVEAEKLARERSYQAALDSERSQRAQQINALKLSMEKALSEADRARLEQEQKALELVIERAARQTAQTKADDAGRLAAEEAVKRGAAEAQLASKSAEAEAMAKQLAQQKLSAEQQAAEEAVKRGAAEAQLASKSAEAEAMAKQLAQQKLSAEQQAAEEAVKRGAAEAQLASKSAEAEQMAKQLAQQKLSAEQQAAELARQRTEAEQNAKQLANEKLNAEQQAAELAKTRDAAAMAADQAKNEAERIRQERDEAKTRLQTALSAIVETRTTTRGIIVNLPDILFNVNRATLKPHAKEKLSRICGIMQVAGEHNLSIEGHTDSIGSNAHNQLLSERRSKSVYNYLAACGLQASKLSSKGLGETQPLVSNDTSRGRQKNRRVEIVIEDQTGVTQLRP